VERHVGAVQQLTSRSRHASRPVSELADSAANSAANGHPQSRTPARPAASRGRASIVCQPDARKVTMTGRCQASHGTVRGEGTCWVPRSPGNGADEPWTPGTAFALRLCLARRKTVRPNHPLPSDHARAPALTLPRSLPGEGSFLRHSSSDVCTPAHRLRGRCGSLGLGSYPRKLLVFRGARETVIRIAWATRINNVTSVLMLAHLTAVAIVAFSLWTLVFVGLPVALYLQDRRQRGVPGRATSQPPAWGHGPDRRKRAA